MSYKKLCNIPDIPDYKTWSRKILRNQLQVDKIKKDHLSMQIRDADIIKNKYNLPEIQSMNDNIKLDHWEITNFDVVNNIAEQLGLYKTTGRIHVSTSGSVVPLHFDSLDHGLSFKDNYQNHIFTSEECDSFKKDNSILQRVFVFLEDWQPGQFIVFEDSILSNWKKGDVVHWKWQTVEHFTVNAGYWDRPLLRLTGLVTDRFKKWFN